MKFASLLPVLMLTAACGHRDAAAENTADLLDNAAEQSSPAAAAVLENEADAIRDNGTARGNVSDPNGTVQNAMQNAGNAASRAGQ